MGNYRRCKTFLRAFKRRRAFRHIRLNQDWKQETSFVKFIQYGGDDVACKLRYTAISIKVVPKTREKVEYERERLIGKD